MSNITTIVTINGDGLVLSVDSNVETMFGLKSQELIGKPLKNMLAPPYKEQYPALMDIYIKHGQNPNASPQKPGFMGGRGRIVECTNKEGHAVPCKLSVTKVGGNSSALGDMYIVMMDKVTDKSATITINTTGVVISCNQNVEPMFGLKPNEIIGGTLNQFIVHAGAPGSDSTSNNNNDLVSSITGTMQKGGSQSMVINPTSSAPPAPDKYGRRQSLSHYMRGVSSPVTNQVRNMTACHTGGGVFPISLQVEELMVGPIQLYRGKIHKIDSSMEELFTLDDSGNILACSQAFIQPLLGYTARELIGRNITSIVTPLPKSDATQVSSPTTTPSGPQTDTVEDVLMKRRRRDTPMFGMDNNNNEWKMRGAHAMQCKHKDGSTFPVNFETFPFMDEGKVLYSGTLTRTDCGDGERQQHQPVPQQQQQTERIAQNQTGPTPTPYPVTNGNGPVMQSTPQSTPTQAPRAPAPTPQPPSNKRALQQINSAENLPMPELPAYLGDYKLAKTMVQGSYGKVQLAHHKDTGLNVAIKILTKTRMNEFELERARRETEILNKLDHPNIAKMYEVIETEDTMNIVMEYAGRTMLSYILERNGLSEQEAWRFFTQILSAIQYCHSLNIIHRDIKHENILLDDQNQSKLIDFGLSNFMEEGKLRATFCGTPAYAAPEMILGKKYVGPEVDIWSMGVVLYSMIGGVFPFENVGDIINGSYTDVPNASPEVSDLIRRMLQVDISKRATLEQTMMHPWVTKSGNLKSYQQMVQAMNATAAEQQQQQQQQQTNNNAVPVLNST